MKFWFVSLASFAMMLAVLATMSSIAVPDSIQTSELFSTLGIVCLVFAFGLMLLSVFLQRHIQHRLQHHQYSLKIKSFVVAALQVLAIVLVIMVGVFQAFFASYQAWQAELKQGQRVVAKVQIEGISDSIHDKTLGMNYRQVATIVTATPLIVEPAFSQSMPPAQATHATHATQAMPSEETLAELSGKRILLSAFSSSEDINPSLLNELQPQQQIEVTLDLQPIPAITKAQDGFNVHRWLRYRHINAQANILAIHADKPTPADLSEFSYFQRVVYALNQWRFELRQHFMRDWQKMDKPQQQATAVTLSLLTGDRALIDKPTKDLYQLAGISHLLAISGTHVLFLAVVVSGFVVALINRFATNLYYVMPRWLLKWLVMVGVAAIYAMFTGFDVPAARTFWMLLAVGAMRLLLVPISSYQVLLLVALIMAWVDPFVLWQAGFWLSFVAVALLISFDNGLNGGLNVGLNNGRGSSANIEPMVRLAPQNLASNVFGYVFGYVVGYIVTLSKMQFWIFMTLLPLSLLLFGKVSWWGLLVNLFAVGLYGWLIVPLNLLAGVLFPILPNLSDAIWQLLVQVLQSLHTHMSAWLAGANQVADVWINTQVNAGMVLVAVYVALPWILPKGAMSRLFAIPAMLLLTMMVYNQTNLTEGAVRLTLLQTKDPFITAQVLQTSADTWLIVGDTLADTKTDTNFNRRISDVVVTTQWKTQLNQLGVDSLTGIIVQSAELASDSSFVLTQATDNLMVEIPTQQVWQARRDNTSLYQHQLCQAGQQWQSSDNALTITAVTGWQQISEPTMHSCALLIDSKYPVELQSQFDSKWVTVNNKQAIQQGKQIAELPTANRIVMDMATDKHLWQVWQLMCKTDPSISQPVSHNPDSPIDGKTLLMTHSKSVLTADIAQSWQADTVLMASELNQYNEQKAESKLLSLLKDY